jgi:predicted dinucleotide-binding enzyme
MTTVGFIGSGNLGGTVARLAVAAGYDVVWCSAHRDFAQVPDPAGRRSPFPIFQGG